MAVWWQKVLAPLHEPRSLKREAYRCTLVLLGVVPLLLAAAAITGSDDLLAATNCAYAACGACLSVVGIAEVRATRRQWASVVQPSFDPALLGDEPDVVVKRRSLPGRAVFVTLGMAFVGVAVRVAPDSSTTLAMRVPFALSFIGLGAYTASFALSALVVKRDLIAVRSHLRWTTARWEEVKAVEPTHEGIVFELEDGRSLRAIVTAKSTLVFLPVRYDKAFVDDLRARIR